MRLEWERRRPSIEELNRTRCDGPTVYGSLHLSLECTGSIAGRHGHARSPVLGKLYVQSMPFLSLPNHHVPLLTSAASVLLFTVLDSIRSRDVTLGSRKGSQTPSDPDPKHLVLVRGGKRGLTAQTTSFFRNGFPMTLKTPHVSAEMFSNTFLKIPTRTTLDPLHRPLIFSHTGLVLF